MFTVVKFNENCEMEWDRFVEEKAFNGTFLQTRRFLNYHEKGKFVDASVMIYCDKNKIAAVCPACTVVEEGEKRVFYSHKGSTFGGLLVDKKYYSAKYMIELIKDLEQYLKNDGYEKVYLRITNDILSQIPTDLMQYSFQYNQFLEFKELGAYIDFDVYKEDILANIKQGKRTNIHNALKEGLVTREITSEEEIAQFYNILCESLQKYSITPVHTLKELIDFKYDRLKNECGFFGVFYQGNMIAGAMMFYFNRVFCAHAQYLAAKRILNNLSPATYLYYAMICEMKRKGFHKISWGIATENEGKYLNEGLIESKESYGSIDLVNRTYYKTLRN